MVHTDADIAACYWDVATSNFATAGGSSNVPGGENHDEITGYDTEFTEENPLRFDDWDFDEVWTFGEAPDGTIRPILRWQVEAGAAD